uniref:Reverse transcriptase zinc-binding domain-containing protein n=1 Tax=Triticum urartu TaxID=4572 RepID=A0A8R7QJL0_TRIUA
MRKYIDSIQLGVGGQVYWGLNGNGRFSTKSMYKWLENPLSGCHYRWIWKAKIPLKIKIFLW